MTHHGRGVLYGIFNALVVVYMGVLVKMAGDIPSDVLVFARVGIGFILFLPILLWKHVSFKLHKVKLHLFRGVVGITALFCFFYALQRLTLVNAILLSNTIPLFVPLVVLIWLKIKIPKKRIVFMLTGFIGIALVLKPDMGIFSWPSIVGLGTGVLGAIALVTVRQLTKTEDSQTIVFYFLAIASIISLIPAAFHIKYLELGRVWLYLLGIGLGGMLYQLLITETYRYLPASKASCLLYLSVVFGGFAEWIFWRQVPDFFTIMGCVLVILGGMATILDKSPAVPLK
ncbi:MAG TPA: DMT family transporter [Chlamydiales bacterium]|nr:DMT family transporter [Chlamydiales bacterium]